MKIKSNQLSEFISIIKLLSRGSKEVPLYSFKTRDDNTIEIQVTIGSFAATRIFQGVKESFEEYSEVTVSNMPLDKFEPDEEYTSIIINSNSVFVSLGSITINGIDKYGSKYTKILGSFDESKAIKLRESINSLLSLHKSLNPIARENASAYHFFEKNVLLYQTISATSVPLGLNLGTEFAIPFRVLPAFIEAYQMSDRIIKLENTILLFSSTFAFIIPYSIVTSFNPLVSSEEVGIIDNPEIISRALKQNQKEMFDISFTNGLLKYEALLMDVDVLIQGKVKVKCNKQIEFSVKGSYLASILNAHTSPVEIRIIQDTLVVSSNKISYLSVVR